MAKKKDPSDEDQTDIDVNLDDLDFEDPKEVSKPKGKKASPPEAKDLGEGLADEIVEMSEDVPLRLSAVLGEKQIVLKDLLKMKIGEVIELDRAPNEFVDIMANGKLVARGELVEIDGKLGVRVIKMQK